MTIEESSKSDPDQQTTKGTAEITIEESRRYFETRMQWHINEDTFEVIEEETCTWVAEVTTTHLGEDNRRFFLLVQHGYIHFVIELRWRQKLAAWFGKYL